MDLCKYWNTLGLVVVLFTTGCAANIASDDQSSSSPAPAPPPAPVLAPPPPPPAPPPPPPRPVEATYAANGQGYQAVEVHFATDRKLNTKINKFTGEPNLTSSSITYGAVWVSIPEKRERGELPLPHRYNIFSYDDKKKYVTMLGMKTMSMSGFFDHVKTAVDKNPNHKSAFIFIHGFNNSFEDAAMRTAQMAVDLDFATTPVFYSWPSKAKLSGYDKDWSTVEWARPHLKAFFRQFAEKSSATDIYVIAHSMGNQPTLAALSELLKEQPELRDRFKEIVLAAADVNADVFREQIAPAFADIKKPITVYSSTKDIPLFISRRKHDWPRLGAMKLPPTPIPGVEIIDATKVNCNLLDHDYFVSTKPLLSDIAMLLKTGKRAADRPALHGEPNMPYQYWEFSEAK